MEDFWGIVVYWLCEKIRERHGALIATIAQIILGSLVIAGIVTLTWLLLGGQLFGL